MLRSVEDRIVQAQQSFDKQFDQLQQKLIDTSTELQKKQNELREYNRAAVKIRQADEVREKDLRDREKKLEAGHRALYTDQINLAAEKKRFYQTKELQ